MAKAHIGTRIDEAQNAQTLQGKIPSDFLAVGGKAVDSSKFEGLSVGQFVRNDQSGKINGVLTVDKLRLDQAEGFEIHGNDNYFGSNLDAIVFRKEDANSTGGNTDGGFVFEGYSGGVSKELLVIKTDGTLSFMGHNILHNGNRSSFLASSSVDGMMSKTDKAKLDAIQSGAINQTTADARYVNLNNGNQTIVGGKLILDNTGYNTHLQLKRTNNSIDYGLDITPSTDGWIHYLPMTGTVGHKFTGKLWSLGDVTSDTNTFSGVNIVALNSAFNSHNGSGGTAHAVASPTVAGFMSSADKSKLDDIQSSAINMATADGRYLKLTGGTVTGTVVSTGGITINRVNTHIQLQESGTNKWHIESVGGNLKFVETGVSSRLDLTPTKATYNGGDILTSTTTASYLASTSAHGFMSSTDKTKLNGIASGAEVNQNAFSHIAVAGNATVNANSKMSTLTFIGGAGVNITTDASGMTVTLASAIQDDFLRIDGNSMMNGNLKFTTGTKSIDFATAKIRDDGSGSLVISSTGGGKAIYLRPDGDASSANQVVITNSNMTYKGFTIYHSGNSTPATQTDLDNHINNTAIHKNWGNWETNGGQDLKVHSKRALVGFTVPAGDKLILNYGGDFLNGVEVQSKLVANELVASGNITATNGLFKSITTGGWVEIGAKNTSHAHFYTDRTNYYFDKEIRVDSGLIGSFNEDLQLRTSGANRITVKESNGYVGIGATAPIYMLHVEGEIRANRNNKIGFFEPSSKSVRAGISSNIYNDLVLEVGQGSEAMRIKGDSSTFNVGIGTSDPKAKLDVNGAVGFSSKVTIEYNATENSLDFVFI